VIVAILAVGLTATLASLWYHRQSGRRALEFWGTDAAVLIAQAPHIEAMKLEPADAGPRESLPAAESDAAPPSDRPIVRLGIGGRFYRVSATADASAARGISNIRRALVLDVTFAWDETASAGPPTWQYALEFRDKSRSVTVFFDFDSDQVGSNQSAKIARLDPAAGDDWRSFFEEQFVVRAK
jgi:hypothetical protein